MNPSVLPDSLTHKMVVAARQLLAADATLTAWGKIFRGRELSPAAGCQGNHIVVAPATYLAASNPNAEDDVEVEVGFLVAYTERYKTLTDAEDGVEDVVERVQVVLLSDETFQTTHGTQLAQDIVRFPLIDQEPSFADPGGALGTVRFGAVYRSRINRATRAVTY